ncbi:MAG: orotate phosphoribosyltransferase [Dehalococcoidia bacterium]
MDFKGEMERLRELVIERSFSYGYFTLSSGKESLYYFDGRLTSLWPEGAYLIGKSILRVVREARLQAVGGPTIGADPIVSAVALMSYLEGSPIPGFIVRKEPKKHGGQRHIEGILPEKANVAIVDDVVTTGGSLLRVIEVVEAAGCHVGQVIVVVDRQEGGSDEIKNRGYELTSLLSADQKGNVSISAPLSR